MIDVMAIFQQSHHDVPLELTHPFLQPARGQFALQNREKMFCPDFEGAGHIYDMRVIDREQGCIVIVRPDQYVADILPLADHAGLAAFFSAFLLDQK